MAILALSAAGFPFKMRKHYTPLPGFFQQNPVISSATQSSSCVVEPAPASSTILEGHLVDYHSA
jgi:hypothetical protein